MKRERVELVDGDRYFSDDHWVTVWRASRFTTGGATRLEGEAADRIRFIALVQHGGGRDEV